jgi:hypothetical protein
MEIRPISKIETTSQEPECSMEKIKVMETDLECSCYSKPTGSPNRKERKSFMLTRELLMKR